MTTFRVSEDLEGPAIRMLGDGSQIHGINFGGQGSGSAIAVGGRNVLLDNLSVRGFSTGVTIEDGAWATIEGSWFDNVIADIEYHKDVILSIINTRASRLYDITSGSISSVDHELNRISYELISTTNPSKIATLLVYLTNFLQDHGPQLKWIEGGTKFLLAKKLVEEILGIQL